MPKAFTLKSNARRAARQQGLNPDELVFTQGEDGLWSWAGPVADTAPASAEAPTVREPVTSPDGGAAWRALYEGTPPAPEPVEDDETDTAAAEPETGSATGLDNGMAEYIRRVRTVGHRPGKRVMADEAPAEANTKRAPRGKTAEVLALACRPEGVSIAEVQGLTGWAKYGGFFTAVKRAGYTLTRTKVDGVSRWVAKAA